MANIEKALEDLTTSYNSLTPDVTPTVERLHGSEFAERYAGFLASDSTLILRANLIAEFVDEPPARLVTLRLYDEATDDPSGAQIIYPQSKKQALRMVAGTARHDEVVAEYDRASFLEKRLIRFRECFTLSNILMPIEAGRKMPDIVDFFVDNNTPPEIIVLVN